MQSQAAVLTETFAPTETFDNGAVVAIYATHQAAEDAVRKLQKSGFDMWKLSIVGKDYEVEQEVVGYYTAGDRMKAWGKSGAFWGALWGLLVGSAVFVIPGIGSLLVAGPLVGGIVGALEGALVVGSLSAFGAGLFSLGIPEDSVLEYETQIRAGKFVLVAHGSAGDVKKARGVVASTDHEGVKEHACCG